MKCSLPRIAFKVDGQPVPWSLWRMVCKYAHGDENLAGLMFYRIAERKPADLIPYLCEGLKPGGYAWTAHPDEDYNAAKVKAWIKTNITDVIHGAGKGAEPTQARHLIADALVDMANQIRKGA